MIKQIACFALGALALAACGSKPASFDPATVQLGDNGKTMSPANAKPSPTPEQLAMIPFQGLWGRTTGDCDLSKDDRRGTLKIQGTRVDYYAAGGAVERIVARSPTSVTVDLRLAGFGKVMQPRTTYRLVMAGTRLERVDQAPAARILYTRC